MPQFRPIREFKLIKKYPSLPVDWEVGTTVGTGDYREEGYAPCGSGVITQKWITSEEVEQFPEYWEEYDWEKELEIKLQKESHQDMVNQIITLQEDVNKLKEPPTELNDKDRYLNLLESVCTLQDVTFELKQKVSKLENQVKELETKLSNSQQSNSIKQQQLANMIIAEDIAREARIERQKSKEPTIFPISPFIPISDQLEKIRRQQLIKEQQESYKVNPNSKPYTL